MTSVDRIQGLSGSLAVKAPVRAATTAAITLSGEQTVDGVAVAEGDRVLVKNQASSVDNGIYDVSSGGWTRSLDFDGANDFVQGTAVVVQQGTTYANTMWKVTTASPVVGGALAFDQLLPGDANAVEFVQVGTGAATRTAQDKLRESISVSDFSTPALADANGGGFLFVPSDVTSGIATGAAQTSRHWGPGRVTTADTNKRGLWFSNITSAPASLGTHASIDTAFNGDLSKSIFQVEHRISGAATLGQPTTGYLYTPEAMPHYTFLFNSSGYNHSTSGNGGRTGVAAYRTVVYQAGQGDAVCYNGSVYVTGAKAGATSFLANPAGVLFNGDVTAGQAGVYLNPRELALVDGGFDVACIGDVTNMTRTVDTGALDAWWQGYRVQSSGSKAIDVAFGAVGPVKIGLDFSFATLPASGTYEEAAVTLKAGQRVYFNANATDASGLSRYSSSLADTYMRYDAATSALQFVVGGASSLQVYSDQVIVNNAFKHMNFNLGFFATTPVAKQTVTGSRGGNAALASLLTALAAYGIITDSSS